MIRRPPRSTLFPYTDALPIWSGRSGRSCARAGDAEAVARRVGRLFERALARPARARLVGAQDVLELDHVRCRRQDRKSTRLNSSHANISYGVFCLKKKYSYNSSASRWEILAMLAQEGMQFQSCGVTTCQAIASISRGAASRSSFFSRAATRALRSK